MQKRCATMKWKLILIRAINLGPTTPAVDPGQPFAAETSYMVNSPVEVSVGGNPAEVINQVGWLGETSVYRVDLKVPGGPKAGMAPLQLTAAWIDAPEIRIPVQ